MDMEPTFGQMVIVMTVSGVKINNMVLVYLFGVLALNMLVCLEII